MVVIIAVFLASAGLLAYLFTAALPAGDAAVYLEQVQQGIFRERTVHLGYLLQLGVWVALAGEHGPPLLSTFWGLVGLAAAAWAGAALVQDRRLAVAPPLLLLGMAPFWEHTLFAEVYGPAAAALLLGAALALHGQRLAAAVALAVACLMHPGSLLWIPALIWLCSSVRPRARTSLLMAAVIGLPTLAVAGGFAGDYLFGDRGVVALLDWPNPWRGAQRAYRLALVAIPLTGPLLLLGLARPVARKLGLAVGVGLLAAIFFDWRDDVPAALPALYLAAPLAAPGLAVALERLGPPRLVALVVALLLVFQIGEATTQQDRARRHVEREVAAIQLLGSEAPPLPSGSFGERVRYHHYVPSAAGPQRVRLPPGTPFDAAVCPDQTGRVAGTIQVFVCAHAPAEPSSADDDPPRKD